MQIPSSYHGSRSTCVHMLHRVSMVIRLAHVGYAPGDTWQDTLAGNVPIGTYDVWMSVMMKTSIDALHPVCSFCQDINHKLPVLRFPSSHPAVIRVYD